MKTKNQLNLTLEEARRILRLTANDYLEIHADNIERGDSESGMGIIGKHYAEVAAYKEGVHPSWDAWDNAVYWADYDDDLLNALWVVAEYHHDKLANKVILENASGFNMVAQKSQEEVDYHASVIREIKEKLYLFST